MTDRDQVAREATLQLVNEFTDGTVEPILTLEQREHMIAYINREYPAPAAPVTVTVTVGDWKCSVVPHARDCIVEHIQRAQLPFTSPQGAPLYECVLRIAADAAVIAEKDARIAELERDAVTADEARGNLLLQTICRLPGVLTSGDWVQWLDAHRHEWLNDDRAFGGWIAERLTAHLQQLERERDEAQQRAAMAPPGVQTAKSGPEPLPGVTGASTGPLEGKEPTVATVAPLWRDSTTVAECRHTLTMDEAEVGRAPRVTCQECGTEWVGDTPDEAGTGLGKINEAEQVAAEERADRPVTVEAAPAPIPLGAVVEDGIGTKWQHIGDELWRSPDSVTNSPNLTALYHARRERDEWRQRAEHPVATRETVERVAGVFAGAAVAGFVPRVSAVRILTALGYTIQEGA